MIFGVIFLLTACAVILLLGGVVVSRNPRSRPGLLFGLFASLLSIWTFTNYFTNNPTFNQAATDEFNRLAYVAGFGVMLAGYLFTNTFPQQHRMKRWQKILIGVSTPVIAILAYSRWVAGYIYLDAHNNLSYTSPPLSYGYALILLILIILTAVNLTRSYRRVTGRLKRQTLLVLVAFVGTELVGVVTNIILPSVLFYLQINRYTPVLTLILVGAVAYAIIRHRLFDVRWVIARSLGYVLAVSVIAIAYGAIIFGLARAVFHLQIGFVAQVFLSLGTGLAGLIFQRFQQAFNRATNRIFYQDAYDPQELFDELNRVLVSNIDLDVLLKRTSQLIARAIKVEFCEFVFKGHREGLYRVVGTDKSVASKANAALMRQLTPKIKQSVLAVDYLETGQASLKELLNENRIAVILRFAPDARHNERLGYIFLGPKKSGNPYSQQDIRVLDTIANELVIAIQNAVHFEEIKEFNDTLQARVDHATRELRRTNDKLQELDATKDDFISMASHQLRTPLTSVKGYLSMLLDGDGGHINTAQHQMLSQAFISSQRMVFLIADLLNVSRLKTGKFILQARRCNLAQIIEEEMSQLRETAKTRDITLSFTPPAAFPDLKLDESKTRQVIMNFMDNAIYYTRPGGTIKLELTDKPNTVELRVIDNGIGVPRSEQRHLFTKFYRAGNARQARPDGTGLGLFMAKKVVAAQGGSIIFESAENQGSTFGFSFPKARLEPAPADTPVVRQPAHATKA